MERRHLGRPAVWLAILPALALQLAAAAPEWIWHPNDGKPPGDGEVRYFRKIFTVDGPVSEAVLTATADNAMAAYLNGAWVTASTSWESAARAKVAKQLHPGPNVLAIRAENEGGAAGVIARLEIKFADGHRQVVVSDATWLVGAQEAPSWSQVDFQPTGWVAAKSLGALGVAPWGNVFAAKTATPAESLTVLKDFKVELVHSAEASEGSWISMTLDNRGRLIVSPQDDAQPLLRIALTDAGQIAKIEPIPAPIHQAMGLLYAHDSLYANAHGPQGTGLYRLIDANRNDQFDANEVTFLKHFPGEGEHGYHAVVQSPDGMIYVINGNHTKLPAGLSPNSPHQHYAEDFLLPRQWDANGHAVGVMAPGGQVFRTDPAGKSWELMLAGFRNAYDFAFNADGEMFTFDSDMEWDWGLPWYRPIRICHCVVGAEFGWRSGTSKWPVWYPDSLPPVVNVGIGSPTGVKFGTGAKFPARYQRALYALDWTYGRILAVHLQPQGATYTGDFEELVRGKPLNVTDVEIGHDGAMYFITGGRGTQSGLYRVSYVGSESTAPANLHDRQGEQARALRHKLESFAGRQDPAALDFAWPHLNDPDRWIRYAARIAVESQPVARWEQRALDEERPDASITALLALARCGGKELQTDLLMSLQRLANQVQPLTEEQQLAALRVLELAFIRMGPPEEEIRNGVVNALSPLYPADSVRLNRELSQLLIYLEAPDVVPKTLSLLAKAPTLEEQVHYVFHLRTLKHGWTMAERQEYFHWMNRIRSGGAHSPELLRWFAEAGRPYSNGASFDKYVNNFRKDAVATLTPAELAALKPILIGSAIVSIPAATNRVFVKVWTVDDLAPALADVTAGRSFARGKQAFRDAQCIVCHRFGDEGGSVGPDLTAVAWRFSRQDLLENIILPSKVVSDQYQNTTFTLKDGEDLTGRVIDEDQDKYVLVTNALTGEQKKLKKSDVVSSTAAKLSPMPEGLVNILTRKDILDLIAYLESGGNRQVAAFKP